MKSHSLTCLNSRGFHRLHYTEWGDAANPRAAICVHGLTRNCRDFDTLAAALENDLRVICVDIAGRGKSDWLPNKDDYGYPQYMADMTALIARVSASGVNGISAWLCCTSQCSSRNASVSSKTSRVTSIAGFCTAVISDSP